MKTNIKESSSKEIRANVEKILKAAIALRNSIDELSQEKSMREMYLNEITDLTDKVSDVISDLNPIVGYSVVLDMEQ